jgi:hypothetical protein
MSTPTTRPGNGAAAPAGVTDDVPSYVAAVRARLDDLSPEEVEELTDGLEADLAEALAGFDETPRQRFGDPAAYADELRSAADLPPRREPSPGGLTLTDVRGHVVASLDDRLEAVRRHPWFPPVRDFLLVVRPAWWVLRAWVAVVLLRIWNGVGYNEYGVFGGFGWLVVLAFAIVASVTLGRRSPLRHGAARWALLIGNVLAVVSLPYAFGAVSGGTVTEWVESDTASQQGLWLNGAEVTNIFPYDSQGRPLTGVQLYDAEGQPITLTEWFVGPNVYPRSDQEPITPPDVPGLQPTADVTPDPTEPAVPTAGPTGEPTGEPTEPEPGVEPTAEPTEPAASATRAAPSTSRPAVTPSP